MLLFLQMQKFITIHRKPKALLPMKGLRVKGAAVNLGHYTPSRGICLWCVYFEIMGMLLSLPYGVVYLINYCLSTTCAHGRAGRFCRACRSSCCISGLIACLELMVLFFP